MSIAVRTGLEPATPGVTGPYSNQLNYRTSISIMLPFSGKADAKVCIIFELYNNTSTFFKKINCVFTFRPPVSIQIVDLHHLLVLPCGIEPQPSEPESEILSIKLREQSGCKNNHFL